MTGVGFRPEFLDFRRGIRVGNLEENERITRLLKIGLESRYGEPFVTERWGRGVFWRWIGYLPRSNRAAKPVSSGVSFGCSKFFISMDVEERVFQCGFQVERGYLRAPRGYRDWELGPDWDWRRLVAALKPRGRLESEIKRLLGEGFLLRAGSWEAEPLRFSRSDYPGAGELRRRIEAAPKAHWAGLQLFYPTAEHELQGATGPDLIESMLAVFEEVTPAMNLTMQTHLEQNTPSPRTLFR